MKKTLLLVLIGIVFAFVAIMFRNMIRYLVVRTTKATFGAMNTLDKKYKDKYDKLKKDKEDNNTDKEDNNEEES